MNSEIKSPETDQHPGEIKTKCRVTCHDSEVAVQFMNFNVSRGSK